MHHISSVEIVAQKRQSPSALTGCKYLPFQCYNCLSFVRSSLLKHRVLKSCCWSWPKCVEGNNFYIIICEYSYTLCYSDCPYVHTLSSVRAWLYNRILIASERLFQMTRLYLCIVILYISALFNLDYQTLAYHGKTCTTTVSCKQPVIHTRVSVCITNYLGSIQKCCWYLISAMVLPRYQLIQWL